MNCYVLNWIWIEQSGWQEITFWNRLLFWKYNLYTICMHRKRIFGFEFGLYISFKMVTDFKTSFTTKMPMVFYSALMVIICSIGCCWYHSFRLILETSWFHWSMLTSAKCRQNRLSQVLCCKMLRSNCSTKCK